MLWWSLILEHSFPSCLYHILQKLLQECAFWVSVHMWFFWIFSESLMSRLPALADQDFIRLSFALWRALPYGRFVFLGSLRCSWQMELEVLWRQSNQAAPMKVAGGHQGHSRSLAEPQSAQARTAGSAKHSSGILQLLWAPGSLTKAVLNYIHGKLFPVSWHSWRALSYVNVISHLVLFKSPVDLLFFIAFPQIGRIQIPLTLNSDHRQWSSSLLI